MLARETTTSAMRFVSPFTRGACFLLVQEVVRL